MKEKKLFFIVLLITLFAQVYFYPFQSDLKLSIGVIIFNFVILTREDIEEITLGVFCGIGVLFVRTIISVLLFKAEIYQGLIFNFPSFLYYLILGTLIKATKIRQHKENIIYSFLLLATLDSLSNIFEALIRRNISIKVLKVIVLAAIIRSLIVYLLSLAHKKEKLYILKKEHQERYSQLNLLMSNIQSEMFYLKKSMKDIEKVMGESYSLYEEYSHEEKLKEKTLNIAREVHEIKKDYHRVTSGLEDLINSVENQEVMTLSTVFTIIRDNTTRYINANGLQVKLHFSFEQNFEIIPYYSLFAILNNLIINSIEACEDNCNIDVIEQERDGNIYIKVVDNGRGIEEEVLPYIFNPGFTTKFQEETGTSSTGIGLAHVKNIIENLKGAISVESKLQEGTTFLVRIPKNSLSR
ncbi:sensor histidine kinase [Clostridium tunisiense]|uniref:sensor histidine kinase n=1 Tax=Clostridium tunisiense TaxID=219748 RepID=UPI0002E1440B|nr:sensor histidine kinase [Clostridium tunisiense]